jgi:hypothetical protein
MKKVIIIFLATMALKAPAAEVTVKGYLVDIACGVEEGSRPDFGIKHSKDCLQMPECEKSGYGVLTPDNKVIRFDYPGNERAKKFIAELKKNNDIKVAVTGTVNGEMMTVNKLELQ